MPVFEERGVRFEYPEGWELVREETVDQLGVTLEGPGESFWMLCILRERPPAEKLIETALESLRGEYGELDVYDSDEDICLLPTEARDVDLVCHDLIGRACVRACEADDVSLFVLYQYLDLDSGTSESVAKVLAGISSSLTWESPFDMDLDNLDEDANPFQFDNLFGHAEPDSAG